MVYIIKSLLKKIKENKSIDRFSSREMIDRLRYCVQKVDNRDIFSNILPPNAIGVELGVASAEFSKRLLTKNESLFLYGIDMWAGDRGHDTAQYKHALKELLPFYRRSSLIRAKFDEMVSLFEDEYFDFVYVDGYAHNGEEGGKTYRDWFPKVKPFGIIAGDDYHSDWPLVVKAVDEFLNERSLPLFTIANSWNPGSEWMQWFTIKGSPHDPRYSYVLSQMLKVLGSHKSKCQII